MIDFFLQSHRLILYLKRQQKVHPAKRFEIFRSRQHGLVAFLVPEYMIPCAPAQGLSALIPTYSILNWQNSAVLLEANVNTGHQDLDPHQKTSFPDKH